MRQCNFPFTAVLGQDKVKNALIWNLINPKIGGVLISGEKGTAKSTLVRSMATLTNKKIIEIPLNITEDRLVGGIDFERAIKEGKTVLEKGLLNSANHNILYVDEVNLLSDSVVKVLLEVAGNGICHVEREGIQGSYESDFILIGSMNPEESGLRPQFIDRFGLYVDVSGEQNVKTRMEIIRRRIAYEANSDEFIQKFNEEERLLNEQIDMASKRLDSIKVSNQSILLAVELAKQANCEGHRAEIILVETAKAICSLMGISSVNKDSLLEAAKYVLPHRMKADKGEDTMRENHNKDVKQDGKQEEGQENQQETQSEDNMMDNEENQSSQQEEQEDTAKDSNNKDNQNTEDDVEDNHNTEDDPGEKTDSNYNQENSNEKAQDKNETSNDDLVAGDDPYAVTKWLEQKLKKKINTGSGKRSIVKTDCSMGRYVRSRIQNNGTYDIAFDATVRAAAPFQIYRPKSGCKLVIESQDIRRKVRERRTGNCILFVVDASASMGVGKRMSAVKGAILSLLSDAYQKRDKVGLITFSKNKAELNLPITHSVELAKKEITDLPTGGKTPLCKGLEMAHQVMKAYQLKEKDVLPVIVLISDGRATAGYSKKPFEDAVKAGKSIQSDKIHTIVIDAEQDFIKLGLAKKLAKEMEADLYELDDLRADTLVAAVQHSIN